MMNHEFTFRLLVLGLLLACGCSKSATLPTDENPVDTATDVSLPQSEQNFRYATSTLSINGTIVDLTEDHKNPVLSLKTRSPVDFAMNVQIPNGQPPVHAVVLGFATQAGEKTVMNNSASVDITALGKNEFRVSVRLDAPLNPGSYWIWVTAPNGEPGFREIINQVPVTVTE